MRFHRRDLLGAAVVVLLVGGVVVGNALAGRSGAVFTTNADGTAVNQNQYASKGDVFLNGGPQNGNCGAAGLSDGEYVFQVTDPSGKTLLSSDDIAQRRFSVSGGVITNYLGSTHAVRTGPCSGKTIGLAPFNGTPNAGGEYKVWVTAAADYSASKGNFGFKPGDSKTDNFKVASGSADGATVRGRVYQDLNANGTDDAEPGFGGIALTLMNVDTATVAATTAADAGGYYTLLGVPAGTYDLCETKPGSWYLTEPAGSTGCARLTLVDGATISQNFGNAPADID